MTAREQARDAAARARPVEPGFYDTASKVKISGDESDKMADAVSDVWEPLLRDVFDMLTRMILTGEDDENWTDEDDDRLNEVYAQTQKALRGNST